MTETLVLISPPPTAIFRPTVLTGPELIEKMAGRRPRTKRCCGSACSHLALDAAARLHIDQPVDRLLADRPHLCPAGSGRECTALRPDVLRKSASSRA